jgi:zinc-RING finger domain
VGALLAYQGAFEALKLLRRLYAQLQESNSVVGCEGRSATTASPTSCSVCLAQVAQQPAVTQCGHVACWSCLCQSFQGDRSLCPTCRRPFLLQKTIALQ